MGAELERARAAKALALERFGGHAAVSGVGVARTEHGYAVKLLLRAGEAAPADLPVELDGVPVRVELIGPVEPR